MSLFTSIACLTSLITGTNQVNPNPVEIAIKSYQVYPDLIKTVPKDFIAVTYPGELEIILGNVVGLNQVQEQPTEVEYYACEDRFYSFFLLDPDVPSRTNTSLAQVRHWHVGNIPGDDVASGETQAVYMGPMPDPGTGPHRYVFLVYRQKKKLVFTEPKILNTILSPDNGRLNFSIGDYAKKYNLTLISANFFQTEYGNENCRQGYEPVGPVT